jgi:hypothetical protein
LLFALPGFRVLDVSLEGDGGRRVLVESVVAEQIKRVACGFRNQANYERRIMLHSAAPRAA